MALVRVRWREVTAHEAELEVDGFDPAGDTDEQLEEAICQLEGPAFAASFEGVTDRDVQEYEVVRAGELTGAVVRNAPAHEPDWED